MTIQTESHSAHDAYYTGRNDYWNDVKPEPARAGKFAEDYKRGYRHARSEDRPDEMTAYHLTAKQVREIAAESGIAHAEFCIEQAESQIGSEHLREARAELDRLMAAE